MSAGANDAIKDYCGVNTGKVRWLSKDDNLFTSSTFSQFSPAKVVATCKLLVTVRLTIATF